MFVKRLVKAGGFFAVASLLCMLLLSVLDQQTPVAIRVSRGKLTLEWIKEVSTEQTRLLESAENKSSANLQHMASLIALTPMDTQLYFVNGEHCKIPKFDPWDARAAKLVLPITTTNCRTNAQTPDLTYSIGDMVFVNMTVVNKFHGYTQFKRCQLLQIIRSGQNRTDDAYRYPASTKTLYFNDSVQVSFEFCEILCYDVSNRMIYTNFYAFAPIKPTVLKSKKEKFKVHRDSSGNDEFPNVLLIGLDSVSQMNFHRKFSQTRSFLLDELGGQEMYGYTKVADNTFANLTPILEGALLEEIGWSEELNDVPFDEHAFIWKNYSDAGYLTLYGQDVTKIAIWNYLKQGFWKQPTDYYYRSVALAMDSCKAMWSSNRRCFGQRAETEMVLDYTQKFIEMSAGQPFFAFNFLTRPTHDWVSYHTDDFHLKFLRNLKDLGVLNNTFIVYFGDHGMRWGPYVETYMGNIEDRMPAMYIVPPTWFGKRYPHLLRNLRENGNRLTTHFDFHETLRHLLNFKHSARVVSRRKSKGHTEPRGISLLNSVPENRSCSSAGVGDHWCLCSISKSVSVNLTGVRLAAEAIVADVNERIALAGYADKCARLKLHTITNAMEVQPVVNEQGSMFYPKAATDTRNSSGRGTTKKNVMRIIDQYLVTVQTSPGAALLQSTVLNVTAKSRSHSMIPRPIHSQLEVLHDISRLNAYGNTSDCILNHELRKVCYCV